jgi:enamine deaminase RidA (YjgF/YER057c/UK114 family)
MTSRITLTNPDTLAKPAGAYSHVARVRAGELMFIAGQVPVDRDGKLVAESDFDAQAMQVFMNIRAALQSQGADFRHVVQFTTYLVDTRDIPRLRRFRDRHYPQFFPDGKYPPNTLLVIDRLASEDMRLEIAAIAAPEE